MAIVCWRTVRRIATMAGLLWGTMAVGPLQAAERFIVLASTTSTEQSGLFAHILPIFKAQTGIDVRVVAVGTGQALKLGERGDADALLVHDRAGEDDLVARGHAFDRRDVMFNDFVVAGPRSDPARVGQQPDVLDVFRRIASTKASFVSRGDDSGTHRLELRLWQAAAVDPKSGAHEWYRDVGAGMGQALNTAAALDAYVLTDRATWASFKNRQSLVMLVAGDARLLNPYSSLLVNPAKGTHIHADEARIWHNWLTSEDGQRAITGFRIAGEQLFFVAHAAATR